jgi:hypothetical protein
MGERSLSFGCVSVSIWVCPDSIWGPDFRSAFESLAAPRFLDRSFLRSDDLGFSSVFFVHRCSLFRVCDEPCPFSFSCSEVSTQALVSFHRRTSSVRCSHERSTQATGTTDFPCFFSVSAVLLLPDRFFSLARATSVLGQFCCRTTVLHFCCRLANGFVRAHRSAPYTSSFSFRSSAVRCSVPMPEPVARR